MNRRRRGQKENTYREILGLKLTKLSSLETTKPTPQVFSSIQFILLLDQPLYETVLHTLTFLSHVVHAVGHSGALLFGVESREASVIIYKEVVCKKRRKWSEL